jgi:hypothetical protein
VFKEGAVESSPETLQRFLLIALRELQKNEDAWPFLLPVTAEEVKVSSSLCSRENVKGRTQRQGPGGGTLLLLCNSFKGAMSFVEY